VCNNLPPGLSKEEIEQRIHDAAKGKRKLTCLEDKVYRAMIVELFKTHLKFHPAIYLPIFGEVRHAGAELEDNWKAQVSEMHDACRNIGASWAWEYLWKNWYSPDRWRLWARGVCDEIPITNSNTYVEALWSTFKRRYLRKYARPKLEFMLEILMSQYLPAKVRNVRAHRLLKQPPDWYTF
jgi:hypothetical protein